MKGKILQIKRDRGGKGDARKIKFREKFEAT